RIASTAHDVSKWGLARAKDAGACTLLRAPRKRPPHALLHADVSKWGLAPAKDAGACPLLGASRKLPTTPQALQQQVQLRPLRRFNQIISIQPKRIIPCRAGQRRVASRREVVNPDKVKNPRPKRSSDLDSSIAAAGVDDHDLIEQPAYGIETCC